jgi:hypothetical protein
MAMTGDELITALLALSAKDRRRRVVGYDIGSLLVELEPPRIAYRDSRRREVPAGRKHQRVILV